MPKDKKICPMCNHGELIQGEDKAYKCQVADCGRCYPPAYFTNAKKKASAETKAKG